MKRHLKAWDTMLIVIPVEEFPPETLRLVGALALEHSSADDLLTFFLTTFHSRHFSLGYPLFAELFFGRKVDLLKEAVIHARSAPADPEGLRASEYGALLDHLSQLKVLGQRRNDIMHGVVCLPELAGDVAFLRRPNKKGKGEPLDNASLEKLLADFRTVMAEITLALVRVMSDQQRRERHASATTPGGMIRSSTLSFRAKVGGKEVKVLRSRSKVESMPAETLPPQTPDKRKRQHPARTPGTE